jgi:peptidoglycan/LPS O-acetylase OafA/YrhL
MNRESRVDVSAKREIRSLTGIRGFAAVYVVLFHYWIGLRQTNAAEVMLSHGWLAVDLFFVLSGFVMAMTYGSMFAERITLRSIKVFLFRRIARIYPLYFVTTLVAFIFGLLGWIEFDSVGHVGRDAFCNFLMIQSLWPHTLPSFDSPAWSISAECAAYVLFPPVMILQRRACHAWFMGLVSALVLAHLYWTGTLNGYAPLSRCIPEFIMGVLAFRIKDTDMAKALRENAPLCLSTAVLCIGLLMIRRSEMVLPFLFPLLILSVYSETNATSRLLGSRVAHDLGVLSFSIYLIHDLLAGVVGRVHHLAEEHHMNHPQTYGAIVGIGMTFPLSFLAYRYVEHPGRELLRKLLSASNRPTPKLEGEAAS